MKKKKRLSMDTTLLGLGKVLDELAQGVVGGG